MTSIDGARLRFAALCCAISLSANGAPAKQSKPQDPVEPARAALRMLQFDKAITLLNGAGNAGNANAQYLLALMYLNGVGVPADLARGRVLLQTAAEHGHGQAAYVLAGELARDPDAPPDSWRQWLDRSAKLGYYRAVEAQRSGRPLLDRESVGASDPNLLTPWVMDCVRKNDAAELRRLGPVSASVRDEFGRGSLAHAAEDGATAAAAVLLEMGADARAVDKAGTTVLMIAAERPDAAMIDLLLKHGADPHAADAELGTLGLRANRVTVDPARQGGKFDPQHPGEIYRGWPPLALAVARNDTANVQQLLAAGADANLRLPQGDPLLQVAADAHALPSMQLLLARGADATATDHSGHSALWLAATRNDRDVVKTLLEAGIPPDAHAPGEPTPFLEAL